MRPIGAGVPRTGTLSQKVQLWRRALDGEQPWDEAFDGRQPRWSIA
jgi:hypothetical protein